MSNEWTLVSRKRPSKNSNNKLNNNLNNKLKPFVGTFTQPDYNDTIIFTKAQEGTSYVQINKQKSYKNRKFMKLEKKADEGDLQHNKPTKILQAQIQQARVEKGWSQKDLANKANVQIQVVQSYENGTAVINKAELQEMSKALNVHLSGVQ